MSRARAQLFASPEPSRTTGSTTCKSFLRVCLFLCILCAVVYVPLFYTVSVREGSASGAKDAPVRNFTWTVNSTRDVAVYVQADNVTAIISNEQLCGNASSPFLLIVVCSAVDNFEAREAIRQTWMSANSSESLPVRTVFLLGRPLNDSRQPDVFTESIIHGDIIQEGFHDAYLNLTLKSVMMLKWVKTHCPKVTFVLKTDDDMYVNIRALVDYLARPDVRDRKDLIVGSLFCRVVPIKEPSSKWYSPQFMFTGKEYPDYVSGTGYVIAGPLIPTLFDTALQVPLFHLEDVFTTGMVARRANVTPENFHLFSYLKHPPDNGCLYRKLITSHGLNPRELRQVWRRVTDRRINCTAVALPKIGDPRTKKCRGSGKRVAVSSSIARHLGRRGLL